MSDIIVNLDGLESGHEKRRAERNRQFAENIKKDVSSDLEATLVKPEVEGLLDDGSLPVAQLTQKITVRVPSWPRVRDSDNVRIILDGVKSIFVGTANIPDADAQEFPVLVDVPSRVLTDGAHTIQYIIDAESGYQALSFPLDIIIDTRPPVLAGAASLPDSYNNTITREDLIETNGVTPLNIPPYASMEEGDTISLYWTGASGMGARLDDYIVTSNDVTLQSITVEVPESVVINGEEGTATVYYYVEDRAGNKSSRSPDYTIAVILNPAPANLTVPDIPLADPAITDADTREPVKARIPKYTNILPGDVITLRWRGTNVGTVTLSAPIPSEAYVTDIEIPRATIWDFGSGTFEVDYVVKRGNVLLVSPAVSVEVDLDVPGPVDPDKDTDENEALLPLTVQGNVSQEDNKLLPQDLRQGAVARIPWYGSDEVSPKAGEIIRIYWGGRSSKTYVDYTVTQQDVTDAPENFVVELSAALVDVTPESPNWPVTYELINNTNTNLAMTGYVNVHLIGAGGPDGLREVVFLGKNARGWLIEGELTNPSTSIQVPVYDNMYQGDIVTLHWIGNNKTNGSGTDIPETEYVAEVTVEQRHLRDGILFAVPHAPYILGIGYGSAEAYYTVEQQALLFESERSRIKVDMEGPAG